MANDTLEDNELNDELNVEIYSTCLVCGQNLEIIDDTIIDTRLEDGSKIFAHLRCTKALSNLLDHIGYHKTQSTDVMSIVKNIDGKMVVTHRNFPNQYIPILLFFSVHGDTPAGIDKLKEWLDMNKLDLSNPSVPVRRLLKKGALSVIVGEDKVLRYFLTDNGEIELNEYLHQINSEE